MRFVGRSATRHGERVVFHVLAVVLHPEADYVPLVEQVALPLISNRIAAVGGVVTEPVRRLDVVGVGSDGLHDPVVTIGRLPARVVEVVQKRKALYQRVHIGRYDGVQGVGRVVAKDRQGRVAIAFCDVAKHLVVGAVFTDDQEHVFDLRRIADPLRDYRRLGRRVAARCRPDILRQIPVVVLEDLPGHPHQGVVIRHRDDADGAKVLVGVKAGHAIVTCIRIFSRFRRRRRCPEARCADAFVVGNEQHPVHRVKHNRGGRIADRNHAFNGTPCVFAEVDNGDCVGVVERDVGDVSLLIDGDRVRAGAIG